MLCLLRLPYCIVQPNLMVYAVNIEIKSSETANMERSRTHVGDASATGTQLRFERDGVSNGRNCYIYLLLLQPPTAVASREQFASSDPLAKRHTHTQHRQQSYVLRHKYNGTNEPARTVRAPCAPPSSPKTHDNERTDERTNERRRACRA